MLKQIVLVDDDPIQHKVTELVLKRLDNSVHYTFKAKSSEMLNYLMEFLLEDERLPDLILLNQDMPDLPLWDFLNVFQAMKLFLPKPISVVVLAASIEREDMERAWGYSCVKGFYEKPITYELLEEILCLPQLCI